MLVYVVQANVLLGQCLVIQDRFDEAKLLLEKVLKLLDGLKPRLAPQRGAS